MLLLNRFGFSENQEFKAPNFKLASGTHETATLAEFRSKVVICFYETKETIDKNAELKDELRRLESALDPGIRDSFAVLAVADCSSSKWPFVPLWEKALREQSRIIGCTLYGDWDGRMRDDYSFVKDEANIVLIDGVGLIRYRAAGAIGREERGELVELIRSLLGESK
jgi:hypothetical protein